MLVLEACSEIVFDIILLFCSRVSVGSVLDWIFKYSNYKLDPVNFPWGKKKKGVQGFIAPELKEIGPGLTHMPEHMDEGYAQN